MDINQDASSFSQHTRQTHARYNLHSSSVHLLMGAQRSLFFFLFIFWLHWVFVAACGLSLVAASGGYSSLWCVGFSLRWLLLLRSTGSRHTGFSSCGSQPLEHRLSSCGAQTQLLHGMWDPPGPGIEPVSLCTGKWTLNHCTTREVPKIVSLLIKIPLFFDLRHEAIWNTWWFLRNGILTDLLRFYCISLSSAFYLKSVFCVMQLCMPINSEIECEKRQTFVVLVCF